DWYDARYTSPLIVSAAACGRPANAPAVGVVVVFWTRTSCCPKAPGAYVNGVSMVPPSVSGRDERMRPNPTPGTAPDTGMRMVPWLTNAPTGPEMYGDRASVRRTSAPTTSSPVGAITSWPATEDGVASASKLIVVPSSDPVPARVSVRPTPMSLRPVP